MRSLLVHVILLSLDDKYFIIYQGGVEKNIVNSKPKWEIFWKSPQNKYISSLSGCHPLIINLKCVSKFGRFAWQKI